MKKTIFYTASLALIAFGMTACGGSTEASEDTAVTYQLDAEATTLKWKGNYADDSHSHKGTVKVSQGTVSYKGDTFEAGSFTVDMKTVEISDLTPETGSDKLMGHLGSADFFNTAQFPNVEVIINSISETEIDATLKVAGKEVPAKMPLKVKKKDDKLTAKGKFTIDFSSMDVNGFKPNPEMEKEKPNQYVKPGVEFELDLVMKAEAAKK